MYSGVPIMTLGPVIPFSLIDRAIPKSMILAFPPLSIMMFWGLRSRWTIPRLWASARPSQTCLPTLSTRPDGQAGRHPDHALEVLAGHVFHGDEMGPFGLAEVEHPADVLVPDLPGEPELVPEPLDRLLVRGDLGFDELEGDLFFDLGVEDLVDPAHPALAEFLDDLVAAGEGETPS